MPTAHHSIITTFGGKTILAFRRIVHKKPVMLFDMQEHRIYVYPYLEFKNDLSERSQRLLQDQYEQAVAEDKIVVFVRDNDERKLVSYSV
jgi:hypothetical protein